MCRDSNGNIWVNQRNTCARTCSCGCHHAWGCNGFATGTVANGNGGCVCATLYANENTSTNTTDCDLYYARQYGLYPFGYNSRCGCTLDVVSET